MKVETVVWHPRRGWSGALTAPTGRSSLGIVVADLATGDAARALTELGEAWTPTVTIGCSTAGQSVGDVRHDGSAIVAVASFDRAELACASVDIERVGGPRRAGRKLAEMAGHADLRALLIVADGRAADGQTVNGTLLATGIDDVAPGLEVGGAIAGPAAAGSWVMADDGSGHVPRAGWATAVGLVGDVEVGFGSGGGWECFGPERLVTRSYGDVLYELDGASALHLYREYLGPRAAGLPGTARHFPLSLRDLDGQVVVRTVVDVDEASGSLRFAGDVPQGAVAQLMCAPSESLVHAAHLAAKQASSGAERLALAISGSGRRLSLGERIEDELDAVLTGLAPGVQLVGMQSAGELSSLGGVCELRNETVTVLTLAEGSGRAESGRAESGREGGAR